MAVALAAPHRDAIATGERAVSAGGNALDAALAAAAMLTVVYPHQCGLGGDLIALVRSPAGDTTAVIGAGTAPAAVDAAAAAWSEVPRQGAHSVTVPGMLAGWRAISGLGARHGLDRALADAATAALAGVGVSAGLSRALFSRADAVQNDPGLRQVFAPDGVLVVEGDVVHQPALGDTLRTLSADPDDFYRGGVARSLVATLRAGGGTHTLEDFAGYEPEVGPALTRTLGAQTWFVAPPPSVGAVLVGVVAAATDDGEREPTGPGLVDAVVRGVHARASMLGDPRSWDVDLDALLRPRVDPVSSLSSEPRPLGDTAAVTAVDSDGWAVTIVQSVYQTFGAGLLDPVTGVLLHNRASAFSVDPASPAAIRPGARPPHTLCPAIVETTSATVVAGCQGGRAQPWILAQLLSDAVNPEQDLPALLARPRWVVGDTDLSQPTLSLLAEPDVAANVLDRGRANGLPVVGFPGPVDETGHVQLVRRAGDHLTSASDPRADGIGAVFGIADTDIGVEAR